MKVEMGEVKVCAEGKGDALLETYGVTTCIVIMLYGTYDNTPFILMDHWNGEINGDKDLFMRFKLVHYICQIQNSVIDDFDPDIHDDIPIYIEKVVIIGGEKEQFDEHGDLLVDGTEASLNWLKANLIPEINNQCTLTKNATQSWDNYLTSGDQSLIVQIGINGVASYALEENPSDLDDSDNSDYTPS
ncbi:MAG: hypothetical protein EPN84_00540 [Legionella sp.]|nr:MAG: hypothetical protein EPN84_00540 [Legionella sp.]